MEPTQAADPKLLASYEGLVRKTAARYEGILHRYEFEDVCQVLRLKVWRSLESFDPSRYTAEKVEEARDSFVFGNVRNQVKDLLKRNRNTDLLFDDLNTPATGGHHASTRNKTITSQEWFESKHLRVDEDQVFGEVEENDPLVPSTLTLNERRVLACMYLGYKGPEIAIRLGLDRKTVATAVRNVKKKMEDWRPSPSETSVEDVMSEAPMAA